MYTKTHLFLLIFLSPLTLQSAHTPTPPDLLLANGSYKMPSAPSFNELEPNRLSLTTGTTRVSQPTTPIVASPAFSDHTHPAQSPILQTPTEKVPLSLTTSVLARFNEEVLPAIIKSRNNSFTSSSDELPPAPPNNTPANPALPHQDSSLSSPFEINEPFPACPSGPHNNLQHKNKRRLGTPLPESLKKKDKTEPNITENHPFSSPLAGGAVHVFVVLSEDQPPSIGTPKIRPPTPLPAQARSNRDQEHEIVFDTRQNLEQRATQHSRHFCEQHPCCALIAAGTSMLAILTAILATLSATLPN